MFIAVELQNDSSLPTWKGTNLDCASFKAEEERVSEILSGKCQCQPDSESSAVGGTPRSGPSEKPVEILLPEMTEPFSQTKGRALLGDLLMMCEGLEPSLADTKGCLLGSCILFIQRIVGVLRCRAGWERK